MDWPAELQYDCSPLFPPKSPRLEPVKDVPFSSGESYSLEHPSSESLYKNSPSKSSPALPIEPVAGVLSLHNYRKSLSSDPSWAGCQERKTLRRKNAASNLNRTTAAPMGTFIQDAYHYPFPTSSTTSSPPPPLSPSYSPSALSEQLPDFLDGYGYPLSPLADTSFGEGMAGNKQNPHKLLQDTFRDRLDRFPDVDTPDTIEFHGHNRARSDSVLWRTSRTRKPPATATVVHQGTSFEILNPHESLDFARIVSYIEDMDCQSAGTRTRDSYTNGSDSSQIISEEPDIYDASCEIPVAEERVHHDLVGDSAQHPIPSISQRLEEDNDDEDDDDTVSWDSSTIPAPLSQPLTRIRIGTALNEPDLGEPGPPIDSRDNLPTPQPTSTDIDPFHIAALYDIGHLPAQGKGTDNPTAVIYSDRKPIRKRSTIRKSHNRSHKMTSSFSFSPSTTSATVTASTPLKRLRGLAQSLRRKTFARASLSS
ncbi:oxidoreductase, short-chain dehydrogenase/reductase family [Aspergillus foveolatus]|uniref:oxidoreductase, short-chain dehydrogenase/reductase family n=1 Tax=Aspergillus foveolatus TaxID=210207 RepID=UPI003CCE477F